jgi:hypothetical protein
MKRIIYIIAILVVLVFCARLFLRQPISSPKKTAPSPTPIQTTNVSAVPLVSNAPPQTPLITNAFVRPDSIDEETWNRLMQARQMILEQNQPVEFYARIVDQNNKPLEGVVLSITLSHIDENMFATTNFLSMKMGDEIVHLPMKILSDTNGWIKVAGVTGKALRVESLGKEGYSWTMPQIDSFAYEPNGERTVGYAGMEDAFNPDKGFVFHMEKIDAK